MPLDGEILHGEIIEPGKAIDVISAPHPLRRATEFHAVPQGMTVLQILETVQPNPKLRRYAHIWIEDILIEPKYWRVVRPKAGRVVTIKVVPEGGGGGGKSPIGTILSIALIVAVAYFSGGIGLALLGPELAGTALVGSLTLGSLVGGLVISAVGSLIISALAPPPSQNPLNDDGAGAFGTLAQPVLSLTGASNKYNRYGPVPRVYGQTKVFPVYAAVPFTEAAGSDQYLRLLFDFGYGPLNLSDHKIGTTPIADFDGIDIEIRNGYADDAPITLYSNTIHEDPYSILIDHAHPVIRTSRINANELIVEVGFNGLVTFGSGGSRGNASVDITVEYKLTSDTDWIVFASETITAATDQTVRQVYRITDITIGQYDIRVTRVSADNDSTATRDRVFLSYIRTVIYSAPVNLTGHCLVAMRIKASNQLNGVVQEYSAIAAALLPAYNGVDFDDAAVTRSPSWAGLDVLRGAANKNPIAPSRIDLQSFLDFADYCATLDQNGEAMFLYDAVFDSRTTVWQACNDILATARGSLRPKDGKWSVVWDAPQTVVVQHFTPRNSWGFKSTKKFLDVPHALRAQFVNPDLDYQQDERIVYGDGYSEDGSGGTIRATLFEALQLKGVQRATQSWREGRYHQAAAKLRPETFELNADIEHIICSRGNLIRVTHDVPRWGLGQARIKDLSLNSDGAVETIDVDNEFEMTLGVSYAIRVRLSDGTAVYAPVNTVAGVNLTVEITTPFISDPMPDVDDLVMFGEVGAESVRMIVQSITRGPDLTGKITFVDESPAIYTASTGPIPAYDRQSTFPAPIVYAIPPVPVLTRIVSDESVLVKLGDGTLIPRISVDFDFPAMASVPAESLRSQYRVYNSGEAWQNGPSVLATTKHVDFLQVQEGLTYELRFQGISHLGRPSDFITTTHTVIGQTTLPADVPTAVLNGKDLQWAYPSPPSDLAGFLIRYKAGIADDINGATRINIAPIAGHTFDTTNAVPGGTVTFFITAVDRGGRESTVPARVLADVGDPIIANIVFTEDFKAEAFPGTIAGGEINISGDLVGSDNDMFWGADAGTFWHADGSLFWPVVTYPDLQYDFSLIPSLAYLPCNITLALTVSAQSWELLYSQKGQSPFWNTLASQAFWPADSDLFWNDDDPYVTWPGILRDVTRERIDFRLIAPSSSQQAVVSELIATLDVDDVEEDLLDVAILAAGTRLPITKSYRAIKTVNMDLLADGGTAITPRIEDRNSDLGPLIKTLSGAGTGVNGHINARVKGY